ncbi:SpaA isopeptide-forming pilin-related protein [Peptoniphilus catoniae]|uniref:SpaA isopeptide-forming pilin-related protein n=1 Tax=Peptoniphilus catoniae TaxID=1660341 RepID=UPI0010FE4F8E|nr:SpaA isopeptide-forming pilin-related protein [Peptoniphilus catoniae]
MGKLKKIGSFIMAIIFILQVFLEPVEAFAIDREEKKESYIERDFQNLLSIESKRVLDSRIGVYKLDLKKVDFEAGYNYALLMSWRLDKNTLPGTVSSITLPEGVKLNTSGLIQDESGVFLGQIVQNQLALINLYYKDGKINFILTEEGSALTATKELFATNILLNINSTSQIDKNELRYLVQNNQGESYELRDLVDEINYEKLFQTENQVIIEEPQGTEIPEDQNPTVEFQIKEKDEKEEEEKSKFNLFGINKEENKEKQNKEKSDNTSKSLNKTSESVKTGSLFENKNEKKTGSLIEKQEEKTSSLIDNRKDKEAGSLITVEESQKTGSLLDSEKEEKTGSLVETPVEKRTDSLLNAEDPIYREPEDDNKVKNIEYANSSNEIEIESKSEATNEKANSKTDNEENYEIFDLEEKSIKSEENRRDLNIRELPEIGAAKTYGPGSQLSGENTQTDLKEEIQNPLGETSDPMEEAPIEERPQVENSPELVDSPRKDILLLTRSQGENLLKNSEIIKTTDTYTLKKTVEILDVNGMTHEEERIVGNYATDSQGRLVFPDLSDGRYTFIKEGEGPFGRSFTINQGMIVYDTNVLSENIIDISEKPQEIQKAEETKKDFTKEKGLIKIEITLTDKEGKPIDPQGAVYSVYRINGGIEEKIDTLTWTKGIENIDPKDLLKEVKSPLQIMEEVGNKEDSLTNKELESTDKLNSEEDKEKSLVPQKLENIKLEEAKKDEVKESTITIEENKKAGEAYKVMEDVENKTYPKASLELPQGRYILKEENPPLGFEKTRGEIELTVNNEVLVNQGLELSENINPNSLKNADSHIGKALDKAEENQGISLEGESFNTKDTEKRLDLEKAGKDVGKNSTAIENLSEEKINLEEKSLALGSDKNLNDSLSEEKPLEEKSSSLNTNLAIKENDKLKDKVKEEKAGEAEKLGDPKAGFLPEKPGEETNTQTENKQAEEEKLTLTAKSLDSMGKLESQLVKEEDANTPAQVTISYMAMRAEGQKATLKIDTINKAGSKLFYGGTSSAEIGNLRDAALNHDATYGVYKKNDQTGNYEPLNIYNKMVYDPNLKKEVPAMENGQPVMVNYKNGKFGTVTLDNLPPGDYVVKEIKSVFQYAFKNLAMKFTVGADGKIINFKDVRVDLADYEKDQTIPSTNEVSRVKLTYNQKMDLDSKRIILAGEVHEAENNNINEVSENQTTKTVAATYHKGNLRVKKVDKNGNPIEGVTLELHGHDANRILRIYRVTTDANGIAEFRDLNVPSYHLLKEVEAPDGYALPNHQWMIYFGEGTWVEFDDNHKPKTEHIPLQISDNQVYATKVQLKPIIKLNPQETRQVVENDKYRPLIDGVTGASIAPKNWFQFLGINNPTGAPTEDTPAAETYWSANWNNPNYFTDGNYEKSFNASKDQLFYNTREALTKSTDDVNVYNFTITNNPRAKVTVNKKDEKGDILPGATFAIYKVNEDGSQTPMKKGLNDWTEVSGLDGKAIFDNIPEGNYVIKETKSPGGYSGDGREYKITVDENANIKFEDNTEKVETLYEKVVGTYTYRNTNWIGQIEAEDIFSIKSKITSIDTKNKTFEGIFYLTCYDNIDRKYINLYLDDPGYGAEFQVLPYVEYFGNQFPTEYRGRSNSATTSINTFETFLIKTGSTNYMPDDMNPDLSSTNIYTSLGEQAYNPNDKLGFQGIDSPSGVIIKIKGSYDGDKPIFTQGVLTHTDRPNDNPGYSTSGVKVTGEDITTENQSQLDFNVTNTRDKVTPLDNKGVIKLSKIEAGTSNLVGGAEFGLYVGKWDQIGERDKPFAKATTTANQIGTETLHDGKLVNLKFQDVPPGTYTLKELSAPYGYEKTLHTWTVRVFSSGLTLISLNPTFEEDPTLEEPVNVNDKITVSDFNIKVDSTRPRTTIYPNINEFFEMTFKTKMANGIRRGNYFTIDLDEKLSLEGTLAQVDLPDMTLNGYVLATGEKLPGTNTVKYTFTEAVENIGDLKSDFTIALSPNRKVVLNDTRTKFTVNVAGKPFTTSDTFGIDYSGGYPQSFGSYFWLPDTYSKTSLNSAFINKIDNENAEIQNIFYARPKPGGSLVDSRYLYFAIGDGILGPNSKTKYELYEVKNPNFVSNPEITNGGTDNSDMSNLMPRSFAVNLEDTVNYTLIDSGTMPNNGYIPVPNQYKNSYLILKTVSPYDIKKEKAFIYVTNIGWIGRNQYTQQITTNIVTKPSKIFTQTDLTEGEVLAFNKKKDPMYFNLWKKDAQKEIINKGEVKFKMEVADDYPDSTPVPDDLKEITFDLSKQTLDPLNPLKIKIPAGMTGEYSLTETTAPKGYIINGLTYRIKVDSNKRTVELISVKDSQGKPVEYKFKLPGAATESSLTATNPAPLYREQVDASGKITVDTQIVSIDVFDPQGEFPRSGGLGTTLFHAGGIGLMTLAMIFIDKRKKLNEYMGKGGY